MSNTNLKSQILEIVRDHYVSRIEKTMFNKNHMTYSSEEVDQIILEYMSIHHLIEKSVDDVLI